MAQQQRTKKKKILTFLEEARVGEDTLEDVALGLFLFY